MIRKEKNGIAWLEFELFQPFSNKVRHGVFLKHGGVSADAFGSLNVGIGRGDPDTNIAENRARIASALQIQPIQFAKAVHGSIVSPVTAIADVCDGLISKEQAIGVTHADCQAALLYDPIRNVSAAVHAGWRGMVKNIYSEAVHQLVENYGSCPQDIIVGISPSLGPCHAEFKHYREEFPESFWKYQVKENFFNLWELGKDQLHACGIKKECIEIAEICTFESSHDYFSYRRSNLTGVHATVISILSQ